MTDFRAYPQLKWWKPWALAKNAQEGAVNCGAAGGAALANWGRTQDHLITHHEFRLAAGNPGYHSDTGRWIATGLSTTSVAQACRDFGAKATRYEAASIWTARDALIAGCAVGLAVDYPSINAWNGAKYSGDKRFEGPHFMSVIGWKQRDPATGGLNSTQDWDSLLDGRCKHWGCYPRAPQAVPWKMIRLACGNFRVGGGTDYAKGTPLGTDKGIFIIVEPER